MRLYPSCHVRLIRQPATTLSWVLRRSSLLVLAFKLRVYVTCVSAWVGCLPSSESTRRRTSLALEYTGFSVMWYPSSMLYMSGNDTLSMRKCPVQTQQCHGNTAGYVSRLQLQSSHHNCHASQWLTCSHCRFKHDKEYVHYSILAVSLEPHPGRSFLPPQILC